MTTAVEQSSKALTFIQSQGWDYTPSGVDQAKLHKCPFCGDERGKVYINIAGDDKDGLYQCQICKEAGNLYQLKAKVGATPARGVTSIKDAANAQTPPSALPDFDRWHNQLFTEEYGEVLDYLICERKFTMDAIRKMKLGAVRFKSHKTGEPTLCYTIPYYDAKGQPVFYKARTASADPAHKEFFSPAGREACLYNEAALKPGMDELTICEGEGDVCALISNGIENVVGVPGASNKKATWIEKLDKIAPKKIYLLYDADKAGQDGAKEMASRIGMDKCWNIVLPEFGGKDIGEWFAAGHTVEELEQLKAEASLFPVDGVVSVGDAVQELIEKLKAGGGTMKPTYTSPWPPMDKLIGGFEDGELVGILAPGKTGKSSMLLNWLHYLAMEGHACYYDCLEMPVTSMVQKWASHVTGTPDTRGASEITVDVLHQAFAAAKGMKGDLLLGYHSKPKPQQVFDTIRQVVRRYGVKVVGFDNLQLLSRSIAHQQQEISAISKDFKALAMELNILIFLIIQPKKVDDGRFVGADDGLGSSSMSKDVDYMICLNRRRVLGGMKESDFHGMLETSATFEPYLFAEVGLTRYSAGGSCTLYFDGATSTVRELSAADATAVQPKDPMTLSVESVSV